MDPLKKIIYSLNVYGKQSNMKLKAYESISHARKERKKYFERYNTYRPHQGLNYRTPDEIYYGTLSKIKDVV
jgi:putative transposase